MTEVLYDFERVYKLARDRINKQTGSYLILMVWNPFIYGCNLVGLKDQ